MKIITAQVEDSKAKLLVGLMKEMGIHYSQKSIKEVDDSEAVAILKARKNDSVISNEEQEEFFKRLQTKANEA